MDSCLSILKPTELYGKGHPYHDLPNDEKIDLAIRKAIELRKERKTGPLPREINTNWNFGWAMVVAWKYIEDLEGQGIVPTFEDVKAMFDYYTSKEIPMKEETKMAVEEKRLVALRSEEVTVCDSSIAAVVANDANAYFSPKWVCEKALGIAWQSQLEKIKGDPVLSSSITEIVMELSRSDTGNSTTRVMTMLPIDMLAGWLFTIRKIPNAMIRERLNNFRREAFRVLDTWARGKAPTAKAMKADKSDELARRRVEIMAKNADWRMAKLILEGMNAFGDVMTPESRTVFMAKYGELVTKHDFTDILPKPEGKWYSATDIASEHGTNKARIGRISNDHDLKAPEGESNEYGTWIRTKSKYSDKEVMGWVYSEKGREWFMNFFAQPAPTGTEGK